MRTRPTRSKDPELMQRIKAYVEDFVRMNSHSPSMSQIGKAMKINKSTAYRYLVYMQEQGLLDYDGKVVRTKKIYAMQSQDQIPIVGCIPCGTPMEQEQMADGYMSVPTSVLGEGDFFVLKASGDSMVDAGIEDGDLVFVKRTNDAQDGDIVAALVDDNESTLKRLRYDPDCDGYRLEAQNASFSWRYVDCRSFRIQGIALHVMKRL